MSIPTILSLLGLAAGILNLICIMTNRLKTMCLMNLVAVTTWATYALWTNQIVLAVNILLPLPMLWMSWRQIKTLEELNG